MKNKTEYGVKSGQKTWYRDESRVFFAAKPYHGKEECDTLIIGGGLAGLSLQSMLSNHGLSCILFEADEIAGGASGMNGGFCTPGWSVDQETLQKKFGLRRARVLYSISLRGFNWMRDLCAKVHPDVAQTKKGVLKIHSSKKIDALESKVDTFNDTYGADIKLIKGKEFSSLLKSSKVVCGTLELDSFHFNPLNIMRSLAINIQEKTGKIFERTRVISIEKYRAGFRVKTANGGIINSKRVVLSTGGYFNDLLGSPLEKKLLSLQTSIGVTEPLDKRFSQVISSDFAFHDDRRAGNYFRFLPDNRLLWGRDIKAVGKLTMGEIISGTKRDLKYFFPDQSNIIEELKIDYAWSGRLGYSLKFMPYVFSDKSGLYLLTGFGGHGMNTAPAAALVVSEALLGNSLNMRVFEDFLPNWNGGFWGKYIAEVYLRWLKVCDYVNRL